MNLEEVREYCLKKPNTTEGFPFDEKTLVFKVHGKMFALIGLDWEDPAVNLKCDPEKAIALREEFPGVQPGYHMHKKYWNTVYFTDITNELLKEWIDHSYELVVAKLPKHLRES